MRNRLLGQALKALDRQLQENSDLDAADLSAATAKS
jgi:hypothetical protein